MPMVGEPFNPWHEACGFWPEDIVDRQRELGDGPKRLYRLLRRYAGKDGLCFPSQERLAGDLGKGERQVRRDLDELEAVGLVTSKSRERRRSNTYLFLWHPIFEQTCMSAQKRAVSGHGCPVNDAETEHSEPDLSARDRTDMTGVTGHPCPPNAFSESPQGKSKQAAAREQGKSANGASADVPRKSPAPSSPEPLPLHADENAIEGFLEMRELLAWYRVRVNVGDIATLIESGRRQNLTLLGILTFVETKLQDKRDQGDAVYSAKLLIKAINCNSDLQHWISKSRRCSAYFERPRTPVQAPSYDVKDLEDYLSANADRLSSLGGYEEIAAGLELLAADVGTHFRDIEALEHRLTQLEADMIAIARSRQSEADATRHRQGLEKELVPYRGKMTTEQSATLEAQFLERKLLESFDLPRLSLFYLHHGLGKAA